MGVLENGQWRSGSGYKPNVRDGRFVRKDASFHGWIRADGSTPHAPEAGRYHLYVSYACPWAHRALLFRKLKGLENAISVTVVDPLMLEHGWAFGDDPDPILGKKYLYEIYQAAAPDYTGSVTVPVLWDKQLGTIVNNESSEIIRIFNSELDALEGALAGDYYPRELRGEIDAINARVYDDINNGVYKCGFATTQAAYDEAFAALFAALDDVESRLAKQRYLCGDRITEADWRLFPTMMRFDSVYVGHFKCNRRRIVDYPNLWGYVRELYQVPGVSSTVNLHHVKQHYYRSHPSLNPRGIVPNGPELSFDEPHGRRG